MTKNISFVVITLNILNLKEQQLWRVWNTNQCQLKMRCLCCPMSFFLICQHKNFGVHNFGMRWWICLQSDLTLLFIHSEAEYFLSLEHIFEKQNGNIAFADIYLGAYWIQVAHTLANIFRAISFLWLVIDKMFNENLSK